MNTAHALTAHMTELGRTRTPNGIFAILADEHNVHAMNEPMLDAWWNSLPANIKGAIFETEMDMEPTRTDPLGPHLVRIAAAESEIERTDRLLSALATPPAARVTGDSAAAAISSPGTCMPACSADTATAPNPAGGCRPGAPASRTPSTYRSDRQP